MDGGRVLRAALTLKLGRRRATELAAVIGQGIAFLFAFLGLISGNVILVFIAIFVYLAASAEAQTTSLMERASHMLVENAMIRAFEALGPQASVDDAAEALLRTTQREFPIVDGGGRLRGVLTREAMIRAMKTSGPHTPVLEAMDPQVPAAQLGERLDTALKRMQAAGAAVMAVNDRTGRFVGYVTNENIAELMMLEAVEWRADAPLAHRK
jgi:stage IV sporulation protein FB